MMTTPEIRRSSMAFPDCNKSPTQRGCLPRPDQVSKGRHRFCYLGLDPWIGAMFCSTLNARVVAGPELRSGNLFLKFCFFD
jgi:hypothetical protein